MKIIQEEKIKTHSIYHLSDIDDAGVILKDEVFDYRVINVKNQDSSERIILLDENGDVIVHPTQYLAVNRVQDAPSTRRQAASALSLLYVHARMCAYDITRMTTTNIRELTAFLSGLTVHSYAGGETTYRTASSVNNLYSAVKRYILESNFESAAFNVRRTSLVETNIQGIKITTSRYYDPNRLRVSSVYADTPPMHLTPEQANRLLETIKAAGDEEIWLAANLQIRTGLRPGELLGITLEDFKVQRGPGGSEKWHIVLRNRCSDRNFQYCKRLYHPSSTEEYRKDPYHNKKTWEVPITRKIRDGIVGHFETFRAALSSVDRKTFEANVRADTVEVRGVRVPSENYYVFHGGHLNRLSQQTYNNHLKVYFEAIGVSVDHGRKVGNCAHRLRHTFAMYHAHYAPQIKGAEELRKLMRHSSVLSIQPYYTPLREDVMNAFRECTKQMEEYIPALGQ